MTGEFPSDRARSRRFRRAAVMTVAVLLAGGLSGGTGAAAAATPGPDASSVLTALARTAAARPAEPRTGRYDYVETKGWFWDETVGADGRVSGRLERDHRQQWIARDGSGRIIDTSAGKTADQRFGPGQLAGAQKLPTDPRALQRVLGKSHPAYGTYEWFVAVNDVWDAQVVSPALESALLRMLVGKPHLRYRGMVTDLQGRRGVAISSDTFHNGRMRTTLVFDPATGGLLEFSQHPLTPAFRLTTSLRGVGATVWLTQAYTTSDRRRP